MQVSPFRTKLFTVPFACVFTLLAGCNSFHQEYRTLALEPVPAATIEGVWDGQWISENNGHHGRLRAIVTPIEGEKNAYRARFHATYAGFMTATYDISLQTERRDDEPNKLFFTSEEDLGWLSGGVYRYEGFVTPERWESTYRSRHDHGRFEMSRPTGDAPEDEDATKKE